MGRRLKATLFALAVLPTMIGVAHASGDGPVMPWYLDQYGGEAADLRAFNAGRLGIVMARAPRPRLLAAWRLLHGLEVGEGPGQSLAAPCCDTPPWRLVQAGSPPPTDSWPEARKIVPGAPELEPKDLSPDRAGPEFTSTPNCFDDAYETAARTLKDRAARFGAGSPDVMAWLTTQDAVFKSCGAPGVTLPPSPDKAPEWLRKDRAYQEAAFDLYDGRPVQAAARFAAIAGDAASPWRPMGPYLQARALEREALTRPSPESTDAARRAIAAFAASPKGTFERDAASDLSHILEFHVAPQRRMAELDAQLRQPEPPTDIAVLFRDYSDLANAAADKPEIADWMITLAAKPPEPPYGATDHGTPESAKRKAEQADAVRIGAVAHAVTRWRATRDTAWLIAALALVDPGSPETAALIADAEQVPDRQPGWLTVQYHLTRLTLASADPARTRARLDAILSSADLSTSDRNILTAERLQVAADLHEFARLSLRQRLCVEPEAKTSGCARNNWFYYVSEPSGVFDGDGGTGSMGLGEDARAVIDRLPLRERIALSRDKTLPAKIRMDIALTSFARALQLRDDAALLGLAHDLAPLLPQIAEEWRRILSAKPGPDRRFAVYMVMAKIPGLRTDLVEYIRPEGTVPQFQNHWMDWVILPRGHAPAGPAPPLFSQYQTAGYLIGDWPRDLPNARTDLTCLGECGRGAAPVRLPDFAAQRQAVALAERAYFIQRPDTENSFDEATGKSIVPPPTPTPATVVWEEMLAYAKANPTDPRIPEALHWIVHASHFGASHDHSGRRAFQLLHRRYPKSIWATRTKTYSE